MFIYTPTEFSGRNAVYKPLDEQLNARYSIEPSKIIIKYTCYYEPGNYLSKKKFECSTHNTTTTTTQYQQPYYPTNLQPSNHHNYYQYSKLSPLINDVRNSTTYKNPEIAIKYGVPKDLTLLKTVVKHHNIPQFQSASYTIKIPSKVEYTIKHHIGAKRLKSIHPNKDVALELCLLFISQLTNTYFTWKDGSNPDGWKSLKAAYLRQLLAYEHNTYKKIRELLETPLMNAPIIECDYEDEIGSKCFNYRLTSEYIGKGIKTYALKTKLVQRLKMENHYQRLKNIQDNIICQNLFDFYARITFPTVEEIKIESQKLIKNGYRTKKGKLLTFQHKRKRESYSNTSERAFVEDGIELFKHLTSEGILLPKICSDYAGRRIVDSIVLMPSYIRKLCKIDGDPVVEVDYSCLHPNIAIAIYGGKQLYITHQLVAEKLNIPVSQVKTEHLKFFNKHPKEMQSSPIYHYYMETEPEMMKNLIKKKYASSRKYKITSQHMLEKEVEIMTTVVRHLAKEGISVGYVYDAIICSPIHANRVKAIMDEQVLKLGVFTTAKINI